MMQYTFLKIIVNVYKICILSQPILFLRLASPDAETTGKQKGTIITVASFASNDPANNFVGPTAPSWQ